MSGVDIEQKRADIQKELVRKWLSVERVVQTASGKSTPALSQEEVAQRLWAAAEYLVRSGTLDDIVELLATVVMVYDLVTDRMVDELAKNVVKPVGLLIDGLTRTSLPEVFAEALADPELEKAILDVKEGAKVSTTKILSLLNNDEVKRGMYILLTFMKALGKAARRIE
ncbi:MAG: DUF1641 domain-containing protein [Pyrobaculum sp.]